MERFAPVKSALPLKIREELPLSPEEWEGLEELRLRPGQPVCGVFRSGDRPLTRKSVTVGDLEQTLELASRASLHTVLPQLRQGFLTLRGGHRLGVCGSVQMRDGLIHAIEPLSALNLRLAREVPGAGEGLVEALCPGGTFRSTLILAPPGAGKTTLLRDLIRRLSDGEGCAPYRVGLADERGEVAALYRGMPQLGVGSRTDVMEGCSKAQALMLLLRGMNPQILAADEITAGADVEAMESAAGCGVGLLCTAHGRDRADMVRRPLYRRLLETGVFEKLLTIRVAEGRRTYQVEELT